MVEFIDAIDVEHLKKIALSGSSKSVKRLWIKRGFDQQISLYGVLHDERDDSDHYCRIEVLSDVPYTEPIVALIYDFFQLIKPTTAYSIWIYSDERESVKNVARYR